MVQDGWVKVPGDKPYYWNLETQETSWLEPDGEEVAWVVQSTVDGGMYYWNKKTDETTWDSPWKAEVSGRKQHARRGRDRGSDEENDPRFANTQEALGSVRFGWKAQQTPEGLAFKAVPGVDEPLASWPHMGAQAVFAHETAPIGKIEPRPMMIVHSLKQNDPLGHMVSFADGRMMMKLPTCLGNATLVPMQGSSAQLKSQAKDKAEQMVEAADHLTSRWNVKGSAGTPAGGVLTQSGMWDINRLQELNGRFVDPSVYKKKMPMNATALQMEVINTFDGVSASFLPGCLSEVIPFTACVEEFSTFEYSSIQAASKRLAFMRNRGLVAASLKVAVRAFSYSWTPGVLASDWKPFLRPKTLGSFQGKKVEVPWWEQQAGAAQPAEKRAPPAMALPGGKQASAALNVTVLLQSVRNTVLDILGTDMIEDDASLMHAGVNSIRNVPINDSLQAMAPQDVGIYPDHQHELANPGQFEPPAPGSDAALATAGGKPAEAEKGCRATATRIRSSASSFYTLMGSSAADYTTMALNLPQGDVGRGPGLSAQPFTAALNP